MSTAENGAWTSSAFQRYAALALGPSIWLAPMVVGRGKASALGFRSLLPKVGAA
jgi:hypothetical protein